MSEYTVKIIETDLGPVKCREYDNRLEFLGVRYALAKRFQAPVPVDSFKDMPKKAGDDVNEPYDALEWGSKCYQQHYTADDFYGKEFYSNEEYNVPESEDCLFLNITVPKTAKPEGGYPVAIWYHGGAFNQGFNCEVEFDGEGFAKRGVILVAANYRVNMFGYFCHEDLIKKYGFTGNYGLRDQFAALDWVKRHIASFSGDPGHVSIFGQSAGSMSVEAMLCSPKIYDEQGAPKICGAVLQSGLSSVFGGKLRSIEDCAATFKEFMEAAGTTLEDLETMDPAELYDWGVKYKESKPLRLLGFGLVKDDEFLVEGFKAREASGALPKIAYMAGCCSQDLAMNGKEGIEGPLFKGVNSFLSDRKSEGNTCYAYYFAHQMPGDEAGAFHSSELWFVFQTTARCWRPFTEAEPILSNRVCDAWSGFFREGNPGFPDFDGSDASFYTFA